MTYSCNIRQKQKDRFAIRLHAVGGNITSAQLHAVADISERVGTGRVHLTTRQGIEIPDVHKEKLAQAQSELEAAGLKMGADGNRVRTVIACPGKKTCRYGSIDTRAIAETIDRKWFRFDTPYKVKFGVTGCPNNCGKARESDIGIMGTRTPAWTKETCTDCGACVKLCPTQAIIRENNRYIRDESACIGCSVCSTLCPANAWGPATTSTTLLIGGTLGKKPRLGIPLKENIQSETELLTLIENTLTFYRQNGRPKERLGHLMNRLGETAVIQSILDM